MTSSPNRDPSTSASVPTGRLRAEGGPPIRLAAFVAQVPGIVAEGECADNEIRIRGRTVRLVAYTMGSGALRRRLSLQLDQSGQRLRYDETRGDLQLGSLASETDISLDFEAKTAQAANHAAGHIEVANGSLADGLKTGGLGEPLGMIELLERRCMSKHPPAR